MARRWRVRPQLQARAGFRRIRRRLCRGPPRGGAVPCARRANRRRRPAHGRHRGLARHKEAPSSVPTEAMYSSNRASRSGGGTVRLGDCAACACCGFDGDYASAGSLLRAGTHHLAVGIQVDRAEGRPDSPDLYEGGSLAERPRLQGRRCGHDRLRPGRSGAYRECRTPGTWPDYFDRGSSEQIRGRHARSGSVSNEGAMRRCLERDRAGRRAAGDRSAVAARRPGQLGERRS